MYNIDQACRKLIENIRNLCVEKHMTMYHLAHEADISQSTLSDLFRGKTKPQVYTLFKICNALEINIESLFEGISEGEILLDVSNDVQEKEQLLKLLQKYEGLTDDKMKLLELYVDMLKKYDNIEKIEKTIGKSENRTIAKKFAVIE